MPYSPQHLRHSRPPRLAQTAAAVALSLAATFATPQLVSAAPDPGSAVKVNQVAYVPGLTKQATVVTSATSPITWTLKNSGGSTVATGQTTIRGADTLSGDTVHIADFSAFDTPGSGYVLSVPGASGYPFDISADPVRKLRYDSLAFFYHQRSGIAIEAQYVGSSYARPAGHLNVSPNTGDNNVPCRQSCGYTLDVRGGWYDAGDHGKYVVNGGIATWQLFNIYERAVNTPSADVAALGDGKLAIPERANGVPDILDEARWELEFLLKMQVPDGRTNAGLVHHKIHDQNWTGLPQRPETDSQPRLLSAVSTAATLNLAAVAAQASRLYRTIDPAFSSRTLAAAEKAYTAAKANPNRIADPNDGTGGGAYSDSTLSDEFYWAAAELFTTTGGASYRADLTGSSLFRGASFDTRGSDWGWVGGLGDTTLALVPNGLPTADIAATKAKIISFADGLLTQLNTQGYPAPFATTSAPYYWGSNGQIANNAGVLALAHDFTGQSAYKHGAFGALDYLLGRNPRNQSYIAGFGEKAVSHLHHRFWANQSGLPAAPAGSLSGGPNAELQDPVAQAELAGCKSQKCFIDDIGAYSVNEVAINWNSGLAWLASWTAEKSGVVPPADTTAPTTPGAPTASEVTTNSVRLTWPASSDPESGVTGYDVLRGTGSSAVVVAATTSTSAVVTGLTAATAYQFSVRARNGAGLTSALSATTAVTTASVPVDSPPTTPGTPVAGNITAGGTTLTWTASTDDLGVAGYDVLRVVGSTQTVVATPTSTTVTLTGLTANTDYSYAVRARDSSGQLSAVSAPVTFRTLSTPPPGGCRVVYSANSWTNGFTGSITLTNAGTAAWSSWTLSFAFTGGQTVTQGWSGRWSQSGSTVTVSNEAWNGSVPAGGSISIGFNGTHSGTNPNPTVFTANGTQCG